MSTNKNTDMQCLRAIAIIMVVMQHYKVRLPTSQSYVEMFNTISLWTGVDIFFALSGLLIYKSINLEIKNNATILAAAKSFFIRRINRLVPALILGMAISVFASTVASSTPNHSPLQTSINALAAIFGVSNFYWSACITGIFSFCGNPDFNGVTWSLSLEWQLYATLCLLLCTVGSKKALYVALPIAASLSVWPAPAFSLLWSTRSLAFVLGCLLGSLSARYFLSIPRVISMFMLALGLAICILSPVHGSKNLSLLLIGIGGAVCLISTLSDSLFAKKSTLTASLVWIGDRSYSIYLLHLPCILITREVLVYVGAYENSARGIFTGIAASTLLIAVMSDISYRQVEQRFVRKGATAAQERHAPCVSGDI